MNVLNVENLNIIAKMTNTERCVVKDLSFLVRSGETLAIVGESGSGKTMTALSIFGLLPDNCIAKGSVKLNGVDIIALTEKQKKLLRGKDIIYIPQSGADFLNPSLKISTQIYESLKRNGIKGKALLKETAINKLLSAGLEEAEECLNKYPFQISGGQAQRVVLAISLVDDAKLVIADEPTKGIDSTAANSFLDKLGNLFVDTAMIIITHDISIAKRSENILVMKDGIAVEYGKCVDVLNNPQHDYTKKLIAATTNKE